MAKQVSVDKRAVLSSQDINIARNDPRMPERLEDRQMVRPKDLPGMNGKRIRSMEQLKSYVGKLPPAPKDA